MDISSWDGTLSPNDFSRAAQAFVDKWKGCNSASSPWLWVNCRKGHFPFSQQVEGYLSLENKCVLVSTEDNHDELSCTVDEEASCHEIEEAVDNATLVPSSHDELHFYDFHIVYSDSYRVPVLYFRGYCSDGRPLLLNEIEKDLPACSTKSLSESKWTFLTQEEHPYLHRPWYRLHPCGTSEWMKLLFLGDAFLRENGVAVELYLISWISVVGQVVGLKIPLEMAKVQYGQRLNG